MKALWGILLLSGLGVVQADQVKIVAVTLQQQGSTWSVDVTLRHADTGWEHYADGWRVLGSNGQQIGYRKLFHPHVDEQPFTRSLSSLAISETETRLTVEAHDNQHGWSDDKLVISLDQDAGPGYRIIRQN